MKIAVHVPTYRPLTRCGAEELAAHLNTVAPSGGVAFARKQEREQKDIARKAILDLFTPEAWPGHLSMLSMPGVEWKFERKLLGQREGNWYEHAPTNTHLTCIENDRPIFHGAVMNLPGLRQRTSVVQELPPTSFAERGLHNQWVGAFFFGNIDDLIAAGSHNFDAAWLDYTGPLTIERLRAIRHFWQTSVRQVLIVTALKARWNKDTSHAIERAGGHGAWVLRHLHGDVLHDIEYQDGPSPMHQIALRKGAPA